MRKKYPEFSIFLPEKFPPAANFFKKNGKTTHFNAWFSGNSSFFSIKKVGTEFA